MFEKISQPVHFEGPTLRLRPLSLDDAAALYQIGQDERIWTYMVRGPFTSEEDARQFIEKFLEEQKAGRWIPFAILSRATNEIIGFTCYLDIQPDNESLEIGFTFLHPSYWGTGAAEESQFLLTQYAIEELGAGRVVLKTDGRNRRAQLALEHFGIVKEGVLRKHMRVRDGFIRDTVMYSVIRDEWPEVKKRGEALFRRNA